VYIVSIVVVLDVLGYVTWHMLRLERADLEAEAESHLQERVRLALWRMDSFMAPIIAQESARPYFHYRAFYPAERAYTRMWEEVRPGDVLVPSPLFLASRNSSANGDLIRLHFQLEPDGTMTSPQVPSGNMLDLAESKMQMAPQIARSEALLASLRPLVEVTQQVGDTVVPTAQRAQVDAQGVRTEDQEYDLRARSLGLADEQTPPPVPAPDREATRSAIGANFAAKQLLQLQANAGQQTEEMIAVGNFRPEWNAQISPEATELLFFRPVTLETSRFRQGIWIDWPMLRRLLLSYVLDLLPDAQLAPVNRTGSDEMETVWMLASLPARLDPGELPPLPPIGFSWTRQVLVVTWVALLSGVLAIGLVLRASIRLSDRRGRFVSAVTHELRTPLTTFCLYTEMLADGVITDQPTRDSYLDTLKGESKRLAGIVENVLAYARLGRPKPASRSTISVGEIVSALEPIIRQRGDAAGTEIKIEIDPEVSDVTVFAAIESVERIVMNLVENAVKYGHTEDTQPQIEVHASRDRDAIAIAVSDHGPGIDPADATKVFSAFHRGREQRSHAQPGLGLGLALGRGLARELGGDLVLDTSWSPGARFVLRLRPS